MGRKRTYSNEEVYGLCCLINVGNKKAIADLWKICEPHIRDYIYFHFYHNDFIANDELINESYFGFIKAVERYNPSKGKFTTYLDWWIKDSVASYLKSNYGLVRVPIKKFDKITKVKNAFASVPEYLSVAEKQEMVADELGISVKEVRECLKIDERYINAIRLDEATDEEESTNLYDIVEDMTYPSPYAMAEQKCAIAMMENLFKKLSKREREVIVHRFGFYGYEPLIEAEIARLFGVSRPYINRTVKSALKKLNNSQTELVLNMSMSA